MKRGRLDGFLFVGPFLIVYATILIYPLLLGIGISFHKADPFGARIFTARPCSAAIALESFIEPAPFVETSLCRKLGDHFEIRFRGERADFLLAFDQDGEGWRLDSTGSRLLEAPALRVEGR